MPRPRRHPQSDGGLRADRARAADPHAARHSASTERHGRQPRGRGDRKRRRMSRRSARCCISRKTSTPPSRACCWSRRCRAISRRCCAARCAPCCPSTTSTSPTGTMRATSRRRAGRFGFDDYVDHLIDSSRRSGPGAHVVAVCQPCVAALAAAARDGRRTTIRRSRASMTLMAGPIDTRVNPTKVNELANEQADRLVRTEPDRARAVPLSRRAAARSIRASCSSPPS